MIHSYLLCVLQVLDTYMFHSFLKARLNRKMDAFARLELSTQPEEDRYSFLISYSGFEFSVGISDKSPFDSYCYEIRSSINKIMINC